MPWVSRVVHFSLYKKAWPKNTETTHADNPDEGKHSGNPGQNRESVRQLRVCVWQLLPSWISEILKFY